MAKFFCEGSDSPSAAADDDVGGDAGDASTDDPSPSLSIEESSSGADFRFDQVEVADFEGSIEGRSLIRSCFFFSLFYMWPYQTFCQTQNFLVQEFPAKSDSVGFVMMLCCTWPMFIVHLLLSCSGLSRRLSYSAKIVGPGVLVASLAIFLFVTLCRSRASSGEDFLLRALYASALFGSVAESFAEPAVYDMAGLFPSSLTSQMVQAGNGACGLIVSVVQMATRLMFNGLGAINKEQLEVLTMVFIALMGVTSLAMVAIFFRVARTQHFQWYIKEGKKCQEGVEFKGHREEALSADSHYTFFAATVSAVGHVWQSCLTIVLTFITTLMLWPVIPGRSCAIAPGEDDTLQSWWFDIIIFTFNLADFLGKAHRNSLRWGADNLSPAMQLFLAVVRAAVLIPIILASCAPQMYPTTWARWVTLLATAVLGLSNGWLSTVCFMRAPKALPPGTPNIVAEQASSVLVVGLFFGISSGCWVAYRLGATVLRDSLGVCYASAAAAP